MRSIERVAAVLLAAAFVHAAASAAPRAKLVSDHPVDCLQVSGTRPSTAAAVLINGHPVAVDGGRHWRVRLPVETVRGWSRPGARTIRVTLATPAGGRAVEYETDLPVGLLGGRIDLAALVVRLR
ncbi:MAG: hypothetical protein DI544_02740 [Sphingomonas taxi]|uniref:Uncharacterized protein n=1 Tax=Sphingomonas taxi TaxID=1549858 RepID=A0A2W5R7B5_9SPHN|nr:MAG: hypothetical protein DI544_02740 [Sphingomonas taxi]